MEAAARHSARAALYRQRRRRKIASGGIRSACPGSRATDPSRAAERSRCEARQARVKGRAETNARCCWLVPPVSRREEARPASEGCLARRYSKSAAKDHLRPQEQCRTAHAEDAQAVLEDGRQRACPRHADLSRACLGRRSPPERRDEPFSTSPAKGTRHLYGPCYGEKNNRG